MKLVLGNPHPMGIVFSILCSLYLHHFWSNYPHGVRRSHIVLTFKSRSILSNALTCKELKTIPVFQMIGLKI